MKPFLDRLREEKPLVADGAMGTLLLHEDLPPGGCPESLCLTSTEVLERIARQYLEAGAEVIQTNTFGASSLKLVPYDLEDRTEELNRNAVRAVRRAVGERAYVSGSCGPTGRMLKPHGDTDSAAIYDSFLRQIDWLVAAGIDVLCVETMVDLAEATLALRAAKEVSSALPVMATMTFDPTPKGFYTIMGVSIAQAAAGLAEAGANVVGSNCGNGIAGMISIAREFRRCSDLPIIIQSNAGLPRTKDGVLVYDESPAFLADKAKELLAAGVTIIGGCCGTTPEHIRALRKMVDERQ